MGAGHVSQVVRDVGRRSVRALTMATADFRVLPDVVIVGVKRGGTTSLFRDLERHPAMCPLVPTARRLPLRENMKGVHHFDGDGTHRITSSRRWYRSHFPTRWTMRHRAGDVGGAFTAEASPYYFFHPLAAARASAALPDALFVVMLRDPVERTVSHWAEQTRNGVETLPLAEALAAERRRVGAAGDLLESGTLTTSHPHEQQTYAAQSEYAASLERWFTAVGRDRLLVLFSEEYYADPVRSVRAITDQLGLDAMPPTDDVVHRNAAPRPASVDAALEARLVERFRPDVARVAELLGACPPWPRFAR